MAQVGVFTGAALAAPDDKGRIALPAALRNALPTDGKSRPMFITTHEAAPCLVGSGADRLETITARIDRAEDLAAQRGDAFDRFALERRLFGPGETIPVDGSGRFILPDLLAELIGFAGELFFYGAGRYFEVWDLAQLLASQDPAVAAARAAAAAALRVREKKQAGKAEGGE